MNNALIRKSSEFWLTLSDRERTSLIVMAAVIGLALLGQILWSVGSADARMLRELPALRRQFETMQANAAEWRTLRDKGESGRPLRDEELGHALRTSADELGGPVDIRLTGSRQFTLEGEVSFDRWAKWIGRIHDEQHLRLASCIINTSGVADRVHIVAEFAGPSEH